MNVYYDLKPEKLQATEANQIPERQTTMSCVSRESLNFSGNGGEEWLYGR